MYVGLKDLPFGNIRAGQFKEPYGLEQITSSNNITFTERSLMNALVPAFNAGVMVFDDFADERATWSLGGFRSASDAGEVSKGDGEWATTARVTGLPMYSEDGREFIHLGLGYSRRSPTQDGIAFSSKPEANLAPAYIGVNAAGTAITVPAETVDLLGFEAAWVHGPFSVSGEYTEAMIDAPSGVTNDPDFAGYYAQVGYFLTGESRGYRKAQGCFDAVKPAENAFGEDGGYGAWEVAARVSSLDLADDGVDNGELEDLTFGVNWYLNPNTRVMLDYILADLDPTGAAADGDTNILAFRVQFNY
jgi:phosphate-selective porin OprO/OprP